jgi:hypothetical protein
MREPTGSPEPALPLPLAADLQDHLLVAGTDLDRLHELLADASSTLMRSFRGALDALEGQRQDDGRGEATAAAFESAQTSLATAMTTLQFQDMAAQLIRHTQSRLRNCADRIACETLKDDDGDAVVEPAPLAPNPVAQAEMDAGSVELF